MKKQKIIISIFVVAVLALTFWCGGAVPGHQKDGSEDKVSVVETVDDAVIQSDTSVQDAIVDSSASSDLSVVSDGKSADNESLPTDADSGSVAEEKEMDVNVGDSEVIPQFNESEPIVTDNADANVEDRGHPSENEAVTDNDEAEFYSGEVTIPQKNDDVTAPVEELTCTLSVRCDTILNNLSKLLPEKVGLVPCDGVIFAERTVSFREGESVFDILVREMKQNKIHLEFTNTPIYKSAYIEGIANLYEFDCGELSGWMYRVNGQFPGYGCSRYMPKPGDRIEWVYTCDLGSDVGGKYSAQNS